MTYHELLSLRLRSERLVLRVLDESFAATVSAYHLHNREHFRRAAPAVEESFFTGEFQRRRLGHELQQMVHEQQLRLFFFRRDDLEFTRIIGDIGFSHIIGGALCSCFLGYKVDRDHTGMGYASEAIRRGVRYMFEVVGLHRIEANIMPENRASLRVIEKAGFSLEGFSPKYLKIDGRWADHHRFALLNPADG